MTHITNNIMNNNNEIVTFNPIHRDLSIFNLKYYFVNTKSKRNLY